MNEKVMTGFKLKVFTPAEVLLEAEVIQLDVRTADGWWTYLPRHIDMVTTTLPSVLSLIFPDDTMKFIAIDDGVLVKRGNEVTLAVRHGIIGRDKDELKSTVAEKFEKIEVEEKQVRGIVARMEADFLRAFTGTVS